MSIFSYFVVLFFSTLWRNYNESFVSFLFFILGLFYTKFSFNFQLFPFVMRVYEFKIILERVVDHSAKLQPMGSRQCHMV